MTTTPPADPFAPPVAPVPAPAAPAVPAPAAAASTDPFAPSAAAAIPAAVAPTSGPALAPGSLVAYEWEDPYQSEPKRLRAGIVVSSIAATADQGAQAVIAWLDEDVSILSTSDVIELNTPAPTSSSTAPAGS